MLKFYDSETAPSPRRARIFLAEKQIPHRKIQIDLRKGEQFSAEFIEINPRCTVPALVTEDGVAICENVAIANYIEDLFPEPNLMGKTPLERALVLQWNSWCEFEGLTAVAEVLRNSSKGMKDRALTGPRNIEQVPMLAERGRKRLGYFFEDLNSQLEKTPYIAGEHFSFADITAFIIIDFAKWVKLKPDESFTTLHDWYAGLSSRPSFQT